ncbi:MULTISPECIES: AMP-binding protein [Bradyrhizobium]|uniref:AMP-binding protein n=1 Tax=Bradyrhizobium TaxID=374 RepID=UPI00155E2F7B|nr:MULTISPECIES: AMP-binding protein [Bradyrhizobium]
MDDLYHALRLNAEMKGDVAAIADGKQSLTWSGLAARVSAASDYLGTGPETIGIFGGNSVDWVVAFLAASISGKTIVPIPTFFSRGQVEHVVKDASIARTIVTSDDGEAELQSAFRMPARGTSSLGKAPPRSAGLIIYTSGSTGAPKGVRLESNQALWSAWNLANLVSANPADRYLSVLPLPMLLELICGVMIPVLVGGTAFYDDEIARSVATGAMANIAEAIERVQPTASVFVPQLLALYVSQLAALQKKAPDSLRFVAVGGAPLPSALASAASRLSIPICEGYGLSECSSVVAMNRPGAVREGTVGRPLPGLDVVIDEGEIVVAGPSVMDGYLGGSDQPIHWRTGDMGRIDADGFLKVYGRKDNLIVTPAGRNVNPEWIETMLMDDPRIGAGALCQLDGATEQSTRLVALLVPSRRGEEWFKSATPAEVDDLLVELCDAAPEYALPAEAVVISREQARERGLFTSNGRVRRSEAQKILHEAFQTGGDHRMATYERLNSETAEELGRFLSIPLVRNALESGGSRELYLSFLTQAYHHVKHTARLMGFAAAQTDDEELQDALIEYLNEERGHEKWILEDIRALGGDPEVVANGKPGRACQVMVGYAYYAIQWISPYSLLGMVHVLEGLSVKLAERLANAVQRSLGLEGGGGFSYLRSHGGLDVGHVEFFKSLVNGIEDGATQDIVIDAARVMYGLYGAIFEELALSVTGKADAA